MSAATIGFMLGCWCVGYGMTRGWKMLADFVRESTG